MEAPSIRLFSNGIRSGPFRASEIQKVFTTGEIPQEALYWQQGMDEWRMVEELREPGVV